MRRFVNNLISVLYSLFRFSLLKVFHGKSLYFGLIERFSPNVVFEMNKGAKVNLGSKVRVHSGCKIKIRSSAQLYIGDNVCINYNCIIACHKFISIGAGTEFGPSVYLFDHDHQYDTHGVKKDKFITADIKIGKNCWIGANSIILRGVTIGDNCVIGAGSLVTKDVPSHSVLIQKRDTHLEVLQGTML